jgi:hypothetical protein
MKLPSFSGVLKSIGPRLVGIICAGAATYLGTKSNGAVTIDAGQLTEVVMGALASYAVAHRAASTVINPGDASTGRIADAEKNAADTGTTVKVAPSTK